MDIDDMIAQLLDMELAGEDDKITFSKESEGLIHRIAEKYKTAGNETNAERIRKMNDEELAESRIDAIHHYCRSENQMWIGDFCGIADSKKEALQMELKWLKGHES